MTAGGGVGAVMGAGPAVPRQMCALRPPLAGGIAPASGAPVTAPASAPPGSVERRAGRSKAARFCSKAIF